jgi:DnaK suppressor protein
MIPDEGDMASLNHNRAINNTVTEARTRRLKSIEQAIRRIDRGKYGSCERCEEDIHIKRLVAMPWARLCLQCQSELEHAASARPAYGVARFDPEDDTDDTLCA